MPRSANYLKEDIDHKSLDKVDYPIRHIGSKGTTPDDNICHDSSLEFTHQRRSTLNWSPSGDIRHISNKGKTYKFFGSIIHRANKPQDDFAIKFRSQLSSSIFLLVATITFLLVIRINHNAPNSYTFVHSWGIIPPSGSDRDIRPPSPINLITSFWTSRQPHPQYKRNPVYHDSLNSPDDTRDLHSSPDTSTFSSSSNQNGWFDLFGDMFQKRPKQPPIPQGEPKDSLDAHVRKILVPRVSGTQGNVDVRNYIVNYLKGLNYHVSLDEFTDRTPIGQVRFANIIATSDPGACKQLAIACHHDSKMMDGFLGAIDSAVPCAMMLELAQTFKESFRYKNGDSNEQRLGLMFIFFDGEEAFVEWSDTDSLYGSRHLASRWERQRPPTHCKGLKNELKRLDLLMVLDLIGTSDTSFSMFSRPLRRHYNDLQKYEKEYIKNRFQLEGPQARQVTTFKTNYIPLEFMQDDHVPFYKRGVPVLSLLANPFPSVWHTIQDNYEAIDFPKTKQILHALERFVENYNQTTID